MSDDHFKCEICRKSFGIAALRDEHQRSRHKKSYRCDGCGKRQWLGSNVTIQEEFNCSICQESRSWVIKFGILCLKSFWTFRSLKTLQMHFKKRHFGNKDSQEFLSAWNVCSGEKPPKNPAVHQRRKDKRERKTPKKSRRDSFARSQWDEGIARKTSIRISKFIIYFH